jgi:tetratricopeptide (TPR) repeat protein
LVGHEPENAEWRRGLAAARLALGTLSLAVEQTEPAAAFLELALAEILRLVELEPTNADWRADLAEILRFVALVELARGRPEQAARRADSALATARQVAAQNPQDPRLVLLIGEVLITRGRIASSRGHSEVARQKWLRALDDLAPLATPPTNNDILAADARARIFLGLADEAREVVARLASAGYAETDLARLCRTQGIVQ